MITIVLNPSAGSAQRGDLRDELTRLFETVEPRVQIVASTSAVTAVAAARAAAAAGAEAVVAVGGDGTISSVASALVGSNTPLGVIPAGTLNHFARDLGIPVDLPGAVATIAARHMTTIDVGSVNDRIFLNNSSIGIYPDIVHARDQLRREGHRKWIAFGLPTWPSCGSIAVRGAITMRRTTRSACGRRSCSSATTSISSMGHIGARAGLTGGRLFIYLAPRVRTRDLPKMLAWALVGRVSSAARSSRSARELDVTPAGGGAFVWRSTAR